jgi:DNA-binding NtrC family response regulator
MDFTKKILVADDEFLIRWSLCETLSQDGYKVKAVGDGEKALEALETEDFDFIITDLVMPGMGGWEVLERAKEICPQARVVIMTGNYNEKTGAIAKERGAYGYVEKPEFVQEIIELLKKACLDDPNPEGQAEAPQPLARRLNEKESRLRPR